MTDMERLQQQVEVQQVQIKENKKAIRLISSELRRLIQELKDVQRQR